jgi:3-phenylpropionate/trans-cinnamate dioxygenase alpha subunit
MGFTRQETPQPVRRENGRKIVDVNALVDVENSQVSRWAFIDPTIYELELEKIFARSWLFLCHESQLPNPGDFFCTYMGEDPVIVVRNRQGQIGAFINSCRHRGARICKVDQGNAATWTCTYHGWTYNTEGQLVGIPRKNLYHGRLDPKEWGLFPVTQVDNYRGLIFGNFDPAAPSLREYLGDFAWYMDIWLDRREGGTEAIGGVVKHVFPTNWKVPQDNFIGDTYHADTSHISPLKLDPSAQGFDPSGKDMYQVSINSHGVSFALVPQPDPPPLQQYRADILPEMEQRLGALRSRITLIDGGFFPNIAFLGVYTFPILRVWHPRGPEKTEVWTWVLVDKAAPKEIKEMQRLSALRCFGPAGIFEQDDVENWRGCTASGRGWVSRQLRLNYQLASGEEHREEGLPGEVTGWYSEHDARKFYQRYAQLLAADSWADISNTR